MKLLLHIVNGLCMRTVRTMDYEHTKHGLRASPAVRARVPFFFFGQLLTAQMNGFFVFEWARMCMCVCVWAYGYFTLFMQRQGWQNKLITLSAKHAMKCQMGKSSANTANETLKPNSISVACLCDLHLNVLLYYRAAICHSLFLQWPLVLSHSLRIFHSLHSLSVTFHFYFKFHAYSIDDWRLTIGCPAELPPHSESLSLSLFILGSFPLNSLHLP